MESVFINTTFTFKKFFNLTSVTQLSISLTLSISHWLKKLLDVNMGSVSQLCSWTHHYTLLVDHNRWLMGNVMVGPTVLWVFGCIFYNSTLWRFNKSGIDNKAVIKIFLFLIFVHFSDSQNWYSTHSIHSQVDPWRWLHHGMTSSLVGVNLAKECEAVMLDQW